MGVIISIGAAFTTASIGTWAFAAALLANPITWVVIAIIAAIAGIIYGVYLLYKSWDAVLAWFGNAWGVVKQKWNDFKQWVANI